MCKNYSTVKHESWPRPLMSMTPGPNELAPSGFKSILSTSIELFQFILWSCKSMKWKFICMVTSLESGCLLA